MNRLVLPFCLVLFMVSSAGIMLHINGFRISKPIDSSSILSVSLGPGDYAFIAPVQATVLQLPADSPEEPMNSTLSLWENERKLGPAHSKHTLISSEGNGQFSHWGAWIIFSSSDGSDPRTNGRFYTYSATEVPPDWAEPVFFAILIYSSLHLMIKLKGSLSNDKGVKTYDIIRSTVASIFYAVLTIRGVIFIFSIILFFVSFRILLTDLPVRGVITKSSIQEMPGNPPGGHAFVVPMRSRYLSLTADDAVHINWSRLHLWEGERELGPPHSQHEDIIALGHGRFSHWRQSLIFSSLDGSDPRDNDKVYSYRNVETIPRSVLLYSGIFMILSFISLFLIPKKSQ